MDGWCNADATPVIHNLSPSGLSLGGRSFEGRDGKKRLHSIRPTAIANTSDAVKVIGVTFREVASGAARCTIICTRP